MQAATHEPDPADVRRVLAVAREQGVAPLLCEVLADESAPQDVRSRVLEELLDLLPAHPLGVSGSAPWTTGRSSVATRSSTRG
jgi:hypothetical protein